MEKNIKSANKKLNQLFFSKLELDINGIVPTKANPPAALFGQLSILCLSRRPPSMLCLACQCQRPFVAERKS
jgi:hypothetical protein